MTGFANMLVMFNVQMLRHEWFWIKNRRNNFANTVREPFNEHVLVFSNKFILIINILIIL